MTEEQIEQNAFDEALEYSSLGYEQTPFADGYIKGVHSLDEEIKSIYNNFKEEFDILEKELNQLRNPWFSVEDKLPKENETILFRDGRDRVYLGLYDRRNKDFWDTHGVFFVKGITHWMSIPKLEKGK